MRGLKEIIKTTVRCYQGSYYDEHNFCPHHNNFAEDIYWRLQWKMLDVESRLLSNDVIIYLLQKCFKEKEAEGWQRQSLS